MIIIAFFLILLLLSCITDPMTKRLGLCEFCPFLLIEHAKYDIDGGKQIANSGEIGVYN